MQALSLEDAYRMWADDLVAFAATLTEPAAAVDAVADVFERLLGAPELWASVHEPRGYLFRSVANQARATSRSSGRRRAREDRAWRTQPSQTDSAGSSMVLIDQSLRTALGELSNQQRSVVFLAYWMDEPVDRVAEILDVRPGTVRRQLARARQRLRGALS